MANIFKSSIGKKLMMAITGLFLVLFLTLHMCLNLTSIFSAETFQGVCDFMGLPIISIIVPVLALGFILHVCFAIILEIGNLKARGGLKRYEVANKAATDSFAAKNMIILGLIVILGLALHLTHFWSEMQLQEWMGKEAADPNALLSKTFGSVVITIIYIVWLAALWFHLTHGFWSAFQTIGWNNDIWLKRWKWIGGIIVTIIILGYVAVAVYHCCAANGWLCCCC